MKAKPYVSLLNRPLYKDTYYCRDIFIKIASSKGKNVEISAKDTLPQQILIIRYNKRVETSGNKARSVFIFRPLRAAGTESGFVLLDVSTASRPFWF